MLREYMCGYFAGTGKQMHEKHNMNDTKQSK